MHEGTTCQKEVVPGNTILHPTAFASKSLTGVEHRYSKIESGVPRHTTQT